LAPTAHPDTLLGLLVRLQLQFPCNFDAAFLD